MSKASPTAEKPGPMLPPPIFWGDEEPKPLREPIYLVYVYGIERNGDKLPIDCVPPEGLPEHPHMLSSYGVPSVELVARTASGSVVARVVHRCRVEAPPPGTPAAAAAAAAVPAGPRSDLLMFVEFMNRMSERTDKLGIELAKQAQDSGARLVDAISRMSSARLTDSQDLFQAMLKTKGGGGAGGTGELAAFEKGFAKAMELVEAAQGAGGEGMDDTFERFKTFMEAFKMAKEEGFVGKKEPTRTRVVDTEGKPVQ